MPSAFAGLSYTHYGNNNDFLGPDSGGFVCKKKGTVLVFATGHQQNTAANKSFGYHLRNYTKQEPLNNHTKYYNATAAWLTWDVSAIARVDANDILVLFCQKYSDDTTTGFHPSSIEMYAVYIDWE